MLPLFMHKEQVITWKQLEFSSKCNSLWPLLVSRHKNLWLPRLFSALSYWQLMSPRKPTNALLDKDGRCTLGAWQVFISGIRQCRSSGREVHSFAGANIVYIRLILIRTKKHGYPCAAMQTSARCPYPTLLFQRSQPRMTGRYNIILWWWTVYVGIWVNFISFLVIKISFLPMKSDLH